MTKVSYKIFDANGNQVDILKTLPEAKQAAEEIGGRYEIFYTYRETYSVGYAWAFKRTSGHQT